jgi:hypothetical protein
MVAKTSTGSGAWNAAIWNPAGTPTQDDDVTIGTGHVVTKPSTGEELFNTLTINGSHEIGTDLKIKAGGWIKIGVTGNVYPDRTVLTQRKAYCATPGSTFKLTIDAVTPDARRVDFGALRFEGVVPAIGCVITSGTFGSLAMLEFGTEGSNGDYWLNEQAMPSLGAVLQEASNEGVGENYASWRKGNVRAFRVVAKWPKVAGSSAPFSYDYCELLRRMVQSPYNVLAVTPSCAFFGHIENIAFSSPAEGGRHHKATISIVEGRDA